MNKQVRAGSKFSERKIFKGSLLKVISHNFKFSAQEALNLKANFHNFLRKVGLSQNQKFSTQHQYQ